MVESIRDLGIWWTFDKGIGSCTGGAEIYNDCESASSFLRAHLDPPCSQNGFYNPSVRAAMLAAGSAGGVSRSTDPLGQLIPQSPHS